MKLEWGPDELGLTRCADQLTLAGLILLERDSPYDPPEIERPDLFVAIIALIPQMSALPQLANPLSRLARVIDSCGGLHRIRYREADQLQHVVSVALTSPPRSSGYRVHAGDDTGEPAVGEIARGSFVEALEMDGEVLVMVDVECRLLAGIGAPLWRALTKPLSLEAALAAVVAEVGDHPDAGELLADAVATLESMNVLVRNLG